jgi:Lipocalin-like domain
VSADKPSGRCYDLPTMSESENLEAPTQNPQSFESFWGSWVLVSFKHVLPSGEPLQFFGEHPAGLIIYSSDGHMSAQLSVRNPKRFVDEQILRADPEEANEAWRSYLGYWGTFRVDSQNGVVFHEVEGSSFPNWIGTEQVRHFRFDKGHLILEAKSLEGNSTLIWERSSARTHATM